MRCEGRVALVNGAGGGTGGAIARRLASEGAHLVLLDVNETVDELARTLAGAGVQTQTLYVDVADSAQNREAVAAAMSRFGAIDCLINNAGLMTATIAPLERMEEQQWARAPLSLGTPVTVHAGHQAGDELTVWTEAGAASMVMEAIFRSHSGTRPAGCRL